MAVGPTGLVIEPSGEATACADIAQAGDGRPLLVATSRATSPLIGVIWDPTAPSTPGRLREWLAGLAAAPPPPPGGITRDDDDDDDREAGRRSRLSSLGHKPSPIPGIGRKACRSTNDGETCCMRATSTKIFAWYDDNGRWLRAFEEGRR
jgi:hypothetical protein